MEGVGTRNGAGHGPGLGQRKGTGVRFLSPPDVVRWVDGFREVNASTKRYRVLMGSAGSGKSMNVAQDLIGKLSNPKFTGANLLVVRKLEEANRASTLPQLIQAAKAFYGSEWHRAWSVRREPLAMTSSVTGCQILFAGMNDLRQREKIKSVAFERGKLTFIWVEEATELSEADFDILDDRLRGRLPWNLYYQITLTFNPVSASHWLKSRFFDHPDPAALVHRSNYRDNPFMDAAYHRRMEMRKKRDPEGYRVYGLGEWGGTEKMVLPHYQVRDFNRDRENFDRVVLGQDFGFNHANAILEVGMKDGGVYVMRELVLRGLDTAAIIERAAAAGVPRDVAMICDSAEPDRIASWRAAGFRASPVKKGAGSVLAQLDFLRGRELVIHPECAHLIRELAGYVWKKDPVTGALLDEPAPAPDDAIAALRYAVDEVRRGPNFTF